MDMNSEDAAISGAIFKVRKRTIKALRALKDNKEALAPFTSIGIALHNRVLKHLAS